jgi:hypothetical protein
MSDDQKTTWYIIIFSVFNVLLGTGIGYYISVQPDFAISVQPINAYGAIPMVAKAEVTVENVHHIWIKNYKHQIFLNSEFVSGPEANPDIKIDLDPIGVDPVNSKLPLKSKMKVTIGSNATSGQYQIKITGFGGDGKERSCMLILKVYENK